VTGIADTDEIKRAKRNDAEIQVRPPYRFPEMRRGLTGGLAMTRRRHRLVRLQQRRLKNSRRQTNRDGWWSATPSSSGSRAFSTQTAPCSDGCAWVTSASRGGSAFTLITLLSATTEEADE
jgi:hypothetical protein